MAHFNRLAQYLTRLTINHIKYIVIYIECQVEMFDYFIVYRKVCLLARTKINMEDNIATSSQPMIIVLRISLGTEIGSILQFILS